ncbi:peptidase S41 family protein [Colletotrichum salicis]|uniref:Peptidase S41 family protein n=1 Tax=Colletotrichum salicis TaxID=1209931 RepID=A0A135V7W3_9PEZI|nr:peptidase S41 family protein [Colletotrichum salicis]
MGILFLITLVLLCPYRSVLGRETLAPRRTGSQAPSPSGSGMPWATGARACSLVSNYSLHWGPAGASDLACVPTVRIPAELAAACLRSVPNQEHAAAELIRSLRAYVQWHSSLAWLRQPPPTYPFPPVNVDAGLLSLGAQVAARRFESEYDFQVQLSRLFVSARDPHLHFEGDVFKPFLFKNDLLSDIVSISADGIELPKLYHSRASAARPGPAIVRINGLDAAVLVEQLGNERTSLRDPDSQWNFHFPSYAAPHRSLPLSSSSEFFSKRISIEYEDGTSSSQDSYAVLRPHVNFTAICSGQAFYQRFCTPGQQRPSSWTDRHRRAGEHGGAANRTGSCASQDAFITGSFLNRTYYNDVAVLAIHTFGADEGDAGPPMDYHPAGRPGHTPRLRATMSEFLAASRDNRMRRLVIDLTGSAGTSLSAALTLLYLVGALSAWALPVDQ